MTPGDVQIAAVKFMEEILDFIPIICVSAWSIYNAWGRTGSHILYHFSCSVRLLCLGVTCSSTCLPVSSRTLFFNTHFFFFSYKTELVYHSSTLPLQSVFLGILIKSAIVGEKNCDGAHIFSFSETLSMKKTEFCSVRIIICVITKCNWTCKIR